jgi:YgiT-type zinc finger domain-containing protein
MKHNGRNDKMKCDNCGKKGVRLLSMSRTYGKGKELLLIENVSVIDCPYCVESYMTADTLHEIERIKLHRKSFAVQRSVQVAAFSA